MAEQRVETIDVFRGIAILMVVLFHYTARLPAEVLHVTGPAAPQFAYGWDGVYFFYLISGYCIYLTLERSATVPLFFARRISRIYPAFVAALVILFALQFVIVLPSSEVAHYREQTPGVIDLVLNFFLIGEIGEWVNGSFWSIAVEVKFYVLVALMALLIKDRALLARLFAWLSLAGAAVWLVAVELQPGNTGAFALQSLLKFLAIAPYLPFFAVGILGRLRYKGALWTTPYLIATSAAAVLVIWVQTYNGTAAGDLETPTLSALVFTVTLAMFSWFVTGRPIPSLPVATPLLAQIGLLSYSWYLLHEPLGYALLLQLNPLLPNTVAIGITMLVTLGLSWLFAQIFEWRFRKPVETLALRLLDWRSGAESPKTA